MHLPYKALPLDGCNRSHSTATILVTFRSNQPLASYVCLHFICLMLKQYHSSRQVKQVITVDRGQLPKHLASAPSYCSTDIKPNSTNVIPLALPLTVSMLILEYLLIVTTWYKKSDSLGSVRGESLNSH